MIAIDHLVFALLVGLAMLVVVASFPMWIFGYTWGRHLRFLRWAQASSQIVTGEHQAPVTSAQPAPLPAERVPSGTVIFGPFVRSVYHEAQLNLIAGVILATSMLLVAGTDASVFTPYLATLPNFQVPLFDSHVQATLIVVVVGCYWLGWSVTTGARVVWRARPGLGSKCILADEHAIAVAPGKSPRPNASHRLPTPEVIQARYLVGAVVGLLGLAAFVSLAAGMPSLWVAWGVGILLLVLIVVALAWRGGQPRQSGQDAQLSGLGRALRGAFARKPQPALDSIAWSEVRGFFLLDHWRGLGGADHAIYGVHSGKLLIVWAIASHSPKDILSSHDTLCRLIVTRTGLALQDVRPLAAKVR